MDTVLVTGGAGYVGSILVPKLLHSGYKVKVLDLFIYGDHVFSSVRGHPNFHKIKGDIRDQSLLKSSLQNCESVIHLACISNDPSFELDPHLGKSINYNAFTPLVKISIDKGVKRFIFASSSSVYGIKNEKDVTEDLSLEPLTDYSTYKALCEDILLKYQTPEFTPIIIRPATICGYSPRLRLDLTVNILTNHAVNYGKITVFGGEQKRPNIHIEDITDLYVDLLARPLKDVSGKIWNAGYENHQVNQIAQLVKDVIGKEKVEIVNTLTDDLRSYHISSDRIRKDLGFIPQYTISGAVRDLVHAFQAGKIPDPFSNINYYNVKKMNEIQMT
ncbi:UDP-glucose 4-epimerase [Candidatus Poribacteria bacterium]|nr:UDP-glucose 4-epimerase [Candidatus Poribacteria bacterium]